MRTVIFANGVLSQPEATQSMLEPDDFIIAADGGTQHCLALRITPNVIIGDLDSISPAELEAFQAAGVEIQRFPQRKDFTDLELAIRYAIEHGSNDLLVLGALGKRWDMTLANLLLPATAELAGARISLVDGPQEILLLRSGQTLELRGEPGDTVSLIPLGGDGEGVTTQGLEYPLQAERLIFGATRGISNVLVNTRAQVTLEGGVLLCVVIHQEAAALPKDGSQ